MFVQVGLRTKLTHPGAALLGGRFLWAYIAGDGAGKVQSLILLSVLAMAAFISFAVGVRILGFQTALRLHPTLRFALSFSCLE